MLCCSIWFQMRCSWVVFFFSSRRRHTRWPRDWSSDVCSSDLRPAARFAEAPQPLEAEAVARVEGQLDDALDVEARRPELLVPGGSGEAPPFGQVARVLAVHGGNDPARDPAQRRKLRVVVPALVLLRLSLGGQA